jgi:hypothetical protein
MFISEVEVRETEDGVELCTVALGVEVCMTITIKDKGELQGINATLIKQALADTAITILRAYAKALQAVPKLREMIREVISCEGC